VAPTPKLHNARDNRPDDMMTDLGATGLRPLPRR
jgi:hypothetical protein